MPESCGRSALVIVAFLYFAAISIVLTLIDLDTHRLPNSIVLPSYLVAGILFIVAALLDRRLDGAAAGGHRHGRALCCSTSCCGWCDPAAWAAAMSSSPESSASISDGSGGVRSPSARSRHSCSAEFSASRLCSCARAGRKTAIPFGPWMILGAWTGIFTGEAIGRWYVESFHWGLREGTTRMAKTIVGLEVTEESVRAAELSLGRKTPADRIRRSAACRRKPRATPRCSTRARSRSRCGSCGPARDSRARMSCSASPAVASWCVSTRRRRCAPTCCEKHCRIRCRICCLCPPARLCSTSTLFRRRATRSRACSSPPCRRTSSRSSPRSSKVKVRARAVDLDGVRTRARHRAARVA